MEEEQKQEEMVKDLGEEEEEDESESELEAVRALPSDAVKELLSEGVCARCIFRLFGLQGRVYASPPSLSSLSATTHQLCTLCLGILQFTYYSDDTQTLLQNHNLPLLIAETVKRHAYQFHTFSLEVSIPPIILHNDNSLRSYIKTKFGSQPWFQENLHTGCVSTKDALKFSLIYPLENLLECKSSMGSFRIRLTYTHTKASRGDEKWSDGAETCKKRKIGMPKFINDPVCCILISLFMRNCDHLTLTYQIELLFSLLAYSIVPFIVTVSESRTKVQTNEFMSILIC